ncbi:carboxypeptidase B-like [Wyeomyia smithii]|uniref:carboxypeptidase B-like n=1 Tax=Wyeomyia smithii TaxID=174621 RepID=UPI0024681199|nr:carboxypeptidase B-like [Wyeomyia smithii]
MRFLVLVSFLVTLVAGLPSPRHTISWDHFWTHEEIEHYIHEMAEDFPDIATIETIGTSSEGRNIEGLYISYDGNNAKPLIIIDGGLRAREWVSPMVGMFIIHELVEHPEEYTEILEVVNFLVIPLVNPDGYVYSHETDRNWIKTRSSNGDNCYGVDLNRNFGYEWGTIGGSSDPCADNFHGSAAFSEPESQALRDTISRYSENLRLYLSVQAADKKVLYPFSYNGLRTPSNVEEHVAVAQSVTREMMGKHGYIYTYGAAGILLPVESGTVTDFVAGTYSPQYTFVLETRAEDGYELPVERLSEVLYETAAGLKVLGEYAAGIRSA